MSAPDYRIGPKLSLRKIKTAGRLELPAVLSFNLDYCFVKTIDPLSAGQAALLPFGPNVALYDPLISVTDASAWPLNVKLELVVGSLITSVMTDAPFVFPVAVILPVPVLMQPMLYGVPPV
jgi:hypothetical protein